MRIPHDENARRLVNCPPENSLRSPEMIVRHAAEEQAEQCLMYHAGLYAIGITGLAHFGGRSASWLAGVWVSPHMPCCCTEFLRPARKS